MIGAGQAIAPSARRARWNAICKERAVSFARCDYESATANPIVDLRVTRSSMLALYAIRAGRRYRATVEIAVVNWGVSRRLFAFSLLVLFGRLPSRSPEFLSKRRVLRSDLQAAANRLDESGTGEVHARSSKPSGYMDAMTMPYKLKDASI